MLSPVLTKFTPIRFSVSNLSAIVILNPSIMDMLSLTPLVRLLLIFILPDNCKDESSSYIPATLSLALFPTILEPLFSLIVTPSKTPNPPAVSA